MPVEELKTVTVFPLQIRRRLASLENAGCEETKLLPPLIILRICKGDSLGTRKPKLLRVLGSRFISYSIV